MNSTGYVSACIVRFVPGIDKWEVEEGGEDPFDEACFEFPDTDWYENMAKKLAHFLNDQNVQP